MLLSSTVAGKSLRVCQWRSGAETQTGDKVCKAMDSQVLNST